MLPAFVFHGIGCCVTHLNVWKHWGAFHTSAIMLNMPQGLTLYTELCCEDSRGN